MIENKIGSEGGLYDLHAQRNQFARNYLKVPNTNTCTRLIASFLTGQMEDAFTLHGITNISPRSIDEVDAIFKLIKTLGAESNVKEIAQINKYLGITLKNFNKLDKDKLLNDQSKMKSEYIRIIRAISRHQDAESNE
jgi:hypothetical protein